MEFCKGRGEAGRGIGIGPYERRESPIDRPGQRRRAERLRRGWEEGVGIAAEITPQYPVTSDNPSVAAVGRQLQLRCPKFFAR